MPRLNVIVAPHLDRSRRLQTSLDRLARTPAASMAIVALLSLTLSLMISLLVRMPQPAAADEFGYLLAADTFAQGRLSNPTHPMWAFFESAHIIQQPTYASKFPPAQSVVLAFGQVFFGHPVVGVWFSIALASAALYWMFLGWLPPRWALLGGLLAALHPTLIDWSQNYWGGALATIGGALLLGGFRRIVREPRARDAAIMAVGMAILANSRPFEGLILTLLTAVAMLIWLVGRRGPTGRILLRRIVTPIALVMVPTAAAMALYNLRVTGNPLLPPYLVYEATYDIAPKFLWQSLKDEPVYQQHVIRNYHRWERDSFLQQRTPAGLRAAVTYKLNQIHLAVLPAPKLVDRLYREHPIITSCLVFLLSVAFVFVSRRRPWMLAAGMIYLGFVGFLLQETYMFTHYAAPATGLGFLLALQSIRYLRVWRRRSRLIGRYLGYAVVVALFLVAGRSMVSRFQMSYPHDWARQRADMIDDLERGSERDLVIVRYGPSHSPHVEWVYNRADIDHAKIVWAHDFGDARNAPLLSYFKDRRVWLLDADAATPELVRYPAGAASAPIEPALATSGHRAP